MNKLQGVADTLYLPLAARIYVSKRFPDYFYDEMALSLEKDMPYEEIVAKSSEYFEMAGACRFYNTDEMLRDYISKHEKCNVINVGCGLETAFFRIKPDINKATFYEMDLPDVIETRRRVLGEPDGEKLIPGDMFDFSWTEEIDKSLPTMITVIGVFQYFKDELVRQFIAEAKDHFADLELLFDAMTLKAINYAANYIKKTGNKDAMLYFGTDEPKVFVESLGYELIEQRPFFTEARKRLKKDLKLYTRIAMKVVDEGGRRGFLVHCRSK
ncbi:MAG: class I SAM-dependent methyltransferase [Firmicutes bacterium]|nr:class I SAM-dependent methyltransferase [Bacillota bacterium]